MPPSAVRAIIVGVNPLELSQRKRAERRRAMLAFIGIRKDAPEPLPTHAYIRTLRYGRRRINKLAEA
jgi:hypothetical protein